MLGVFCVANSGLARKQKGLIRLRYTKDRTEDVRPIYEKWNSFSRITVTGNWNEPEIPDGWGLSPNMPEDLRVRQLHLTIDSTAGTVMTNYTGKPEEISHLKYDITNLAHHVRRDADVLVVGVGGGRDILSALAFDQKSVIGVELNGNILKTVNKVFRDWTGNLPRLGNVRFVNDEARSWIARTEEQFDILQVSLIDTWAATAAGAFALSENSLYTIEAWRLFLDHLTDDGVLTFSRWWSDVTAHESYRIATLAVAALEERGVENPRDHILMAKVGFKHRYFSHETAGVSTLLVSPSPFSDEDIDRFEAACDEYAFDVVMSPREVHDEALASLTSPSREEREAFIAGFPVNISPPTDNSPFFFNMLRLRDMFNWTKMADETMAFNYRAVSVLGTLLITVVVLTSLCILLPLFLTTSKGSLKGAGPLFIYFGGIGLGFMMVEIALLQRLIIFLGHPTYSLAVVLFTLLVASGIGSYLTDRVSEDTLWRQGRTRLAALLVIVAFMGIVAPVAAAKLEGAATLVRVGAAAVMLFPLGLFMGMCFPIGMKLAATRWQGVTPWLWGINGAASVTASVLSVAIALAFSIPVAYWCGFACYAATAAAFWATGRKTLADAG